jgi:NADPH2:quinone reductase
LLARAELLVKVPAGLDMDLAAGGLLQGMTAQYLVHRVRTTVAGEVALVHAAAGGTGHLLVQVLVQAGVRVLATCSSVEKEALVRRAGAHEVIRYTEVDFAARVRELTAGRGVDVVYDSVGKTTFDGSLKCIRPRGLMVLFGQASGAVPAYEAVDYPDSLFLPIKENFTREPIGFAMRKGDPDTLAYFNSWITTVQLEGWLQERHDYWFGTKDWQGQVE